MMEESYTACVDPLWGGPVAAADLDGFSALQINAGANAQAQAAQPCNQAQPAAKSHILGPETLCRTSVTRGRRICVAVGDDCCTQKVLKYASKYIVKSKDAVTLVHVCCKGHKSGQDQQQGQQQQQQGQQQVQKTPATAPPEASAAGTAAAGGVGANGASAETGPAAGVAAGAERRHPSSGAQEGCEGEGSGMHAGGSSGNSGSGGSSSKCGESVAAAHQLLERAKAALLRSGKVRPEQVSAVLLPPAKHVGQALVRHCLHNNYDILVIGCRGSGSSIKAKLRSLMGGSCPSVSKYCAQHLSQPLAVVAVAPPEGHDWGPKC